MFAYLILEALFCGAHAQAPVYDTTGVNGNANGYVNYAADPNAPLQQVWTAPQQQQYGQPVPILASEYIQSGQLPTWNPNYASNAQGYFVPVIVDVEDELPADFAQNLVDPAQIEQLQAVVGGVPPIAWEQQAYAN